MSKFGFVPNSAKLTILDTDGEEYCTFENLTLSVEKVINEDGNKSIDFNFTEDEIK